MLKPFAFLSILGGALALTSAQTPPSHKPPQPTPAIEKLIDDANKLPIKDRLPALEAGLPQAIAINDKPGEAALDLWCGRYAHDLGENDRAIKFDGAALDLFRVLGDHPSEGIILNNIGSVYDARGQKQKALEFYQQALPIEKEVGVSRFMIWRETSHRVFALK